MRAEGYCRVLNLRVTVGYRICRVCFYNRFWSSVASVQSLKEPSHLDPVTLSVARKCKPQWFTFYWMW